MDDFAQPFEHKDLVNTTFFKVAIQCFSGKMGPGTNYNALCVSKVSELSDGDKEDLKKLCPPEEFIAISQENCKPPWKP